VRVVINGSIVSTRTRARRHNEEVEYDPGTEYGLRLLAGVLSTDENRHAHNPRYAGRSHTVNDKPCTHCKSYSHDSKSCSWKKGKK
jgi:hypothetical protein